MTEQDRMVTAETAFTWACKECPEHGESAEGIRSPWVHAQETGHVTERMVVTTYKPHRGAP